VSIGTDSIFAGRRE
jgi:hypothetical protein